MGKLFLIPNTLGDSNIYGVLPSEVIARIKNIKIFASENPKNTRRFLKQIDKSIVLEELTFLELNEHSDRKAVEACLPYLEKEESVLFQRPVVRESQIPEQNWSL